LLVHVWFAATKTMPKFTSHIFICCNRREPGNARGCCDVDGSQSLKNCFKAEIKRRGLNLSVRANESGCLDQCELGPAVVIYPQAVWYGGVTLEDVPRIIAETVIGGRVLEDLVIVDSQLNATPRHLAKSPGKAKPPGESL